MPFMLLVYRAKVFTVQDHVGLVGRDDSGIGVILATEHYPRPASESTVVSSCPTCSMCELIKADHGSSSILSMTREFFPIICC